MIHVLRVPARKLLLSAVLLAASATASYAQLGVGPPGGAENGRRHHCQGRQPDCAPLRPGNHLCSGSGPCRRQAPAARHAVPNSAKPGPQQAAAGQGRNRLGGGRGFAGKKRAGPPHGLLRAADWLREEAGGILQQAAETAQGRAAHSGEGAADAAEDAGPDCR